MLATLTSKGQITLPKEIRDRLGLDAGSILDFKILEDNTIAVRQVVPDARRIRGLLKPPASALATAPLTVALMDDAVSQLLKDRHGPTTKRRKAAGS